MAGVELANLLPRYLKLLINNSKPRDEVYGAYDHSYLQSSAPISHTQSPAVTGTSVLAVKFKDGVVIAADNLGMPHISLFTLPPSLIPLFPSAKT